MTITLVCLLGISGKSLFVKTLVDQEIIKVRERIFHICLIPKVILLKLFLDIVPTAARCADRRSDFFETTFHEMAETS